MAKLSVLPMATPMQTKGFTLAEVLVVLFIISIMTTLSLNKLPSLHFEDDIFISEYHLSLAKAMAQKDTTSVAHPLSPYLLRFNQNGTIDKAATINGYQKEMIAHLGSSYLTYED